MIKNKQIKINKYNYIWCIIMHQIFQQRIEGVATFLFKSDKFSFIKMYIYVYRQTPVYNIHTPVHE